jgi:hypothetical protein
MVKECINPECSKKPAFNYKNDIGSHYCGSHRETRILEDGHEELMVNKSKQVCKEERCYKNTCKHDKFNYCAKHTKIKADPIIRTKKDPFTHAKYCIVKTCKKTSLFNYKGLKPKYCKDCMVKEGFELGNKKDQMRDMKTLLCQFIFEDGLDCIKCALYGNDKQKIYCKDHKDTDMTKSVKVKKCIIDGCILQPSFGYIEIKSKILCKQHYEEHEDKDLMGSIFQECKYINDETGLKCNERAYYKYKDGKVILYCNNHKEDTMIDSRKSICIEIGCKLNAIYNYKVETGARYCKNHSNDNMVSKKVKICKYKDCLIEAYFGTKDDTKQFCVKHKTDDDMNDYTSPRCEDCNLFHVRHGNKKCSYCNPDARQKIKENKIKDFLKENKIKFIHDKAVGGKNDCGYYRPDFLIDCNTHFIIIEVDENQHSNYDNTCEISRMNNLYLLLGLPIIFIRFNPDNFNSKTKNNILYNNRLDQLLNIINESKVKTDIKFIELIYMYYNCDCNKCNYIHYKDFITHSMDTLTI